MIVDRTKIRRCLEELPIKYRLGILFLLGLSLNLPNILPWVTWWWLFIVFGMAVVLTSNMTAKQIPDSPLSKRSFLCYGAFGLGLFIVVLYHQPSESIDVAWFLELISLAIFTMFVWMGFVSGLRHAEVSWQRPYPYVKRIVVWLFILLLAFSAHINIIKIAVVFLLIIKSYQWLFITKWPPTVKRAFIFSVLFPLTIGVGAVVYYDIKQQQARQLANRVIAQVDDYYDKYGEYPLTKAIKPMNVEGRMVHPKVYYNNNGSNATIFYIKPMAMYCTYRYEFSSKKWEEWCD